MATDAEAARRTEEIPAWKQSEVDELVELIDSYETIGIVSFMGIPSRQLQAMRRDLHGEAELRISRNTLLRRALTAVDRDLSPLLPHVSGQVGIIATDDNPFGLYRKLEASKTSAPINAGEVAPNDIVIDAGDTGIDPGPFVGELQQVGAEARIQDGSIHVTADSTVAEEGDVVSEQLANVLSELEMEPKEVGLDLRAVFADGIVFEPEELVLDIDAYRTDIQSASGRALSLAIGTSYPAPDAIGAILQAARADATAVGLSAAIEDPAVMPDLVAKADAQVRSIARLIDDEEALPSELHEVPAEPAEPAEPEPTEEDREDESEPEEPDEDDDAEDDDDGDGAEGLGAMFG